MMGFVAALLTSRRLVTIITLPQHLVLANTIARVWVLFVRRFLVYYISRLLVYWFNFFRGEVYAVQVLQVDSWVLSIFLSSHL